MSGALKATKIAAHIFTTLGVSKVVTDIIKNNTTIVTTADALKVNIGSFVLVSLVVERSLRHVEMWTNEIINNYRKMKEKKEESAVPVPKSTP